MLGKYSVTSQGDGEVEINANVTIAGKEMNIKGQGNGPISAFFHGLKESGYANCKISDYSEHTLGMGADAEAIAYVQIECEHGKHYGVGVDSNIDSASIKAILSSLRLMDTDK